MFTQDTLRALSISHTSDLHWGLHAEQEEELLERIRGETDLAAISKLEVASFLGERLLRDTDAASMAVSLEVRVPLLDHVFVEAAARIEDSIRFNPIGKKSFLREIARDQIDPAEFDRPKWGFELPLALWCRQHLRPRLDSTFHDDQIAQALRLNMDTVGRIWRSFQNGGNGIHWSRVWSLYVLLSWCRRHGAYV